MDLSRVEVAHADSRAHGAAGAQLSRQQRHSQLLLELGVPLPLAGPARAAASCICREQQLQRLWGCVSGLCP